MIKRNDLLMANPTSINPKLDLVFERVSTLTPEQIWKGWTDPETLKKWFCPRPWKVTECRIDLRPGGQFYTKMQGPEGQEMPGDGCYLEVIPNKKLITTNMMTQGFKPASVTTLGFAYVITIHLSKTDKGTHYRAVVSHADEAGRKKHEEMGFQEGWGLAFDQLVELAKEKTL